MSPFRKPSVAARVLVALVGAALVGGTAGCGVLGGGGDQKHLTAHFARTVGLYKHSDVRVLGVETFDTQ